MTLNLPKKRLSYSQFTLWRRNKDAYRRDYYFGVKRDPNAEMRYGDAFAKMLQSGARGPVIDLVPRYSVSEYEMNVEIQEVPILAFVDSFDPATKRFLEYKTGHKDKKGKVPWDLVKVRKHEQMPFYCACIKAEHGMYEPNTQLIWIETEALPVTEMFGSRELVATDKRTLRLTGRIDIFPRKISQWEVKRMGDLIRETAEEISEDFTRYQKDLFGK